MTIHLNSFSQGFGADVGGFDAHNERSAAAIEAMRDALHRYGLLLLRECGRLSPQRQAEIISWFGTVNVGGMPDEVATTMDNANEAGRAKLLFHSDLTFLRYPLDGISLHPLQLPSVDTSTTFVSNAVAWDTLAPDVQDEVRHRKARHFYKRDARMGEVEAFETWHPMCLPHPVTGRSLLFVTEHHVDQVEGLSQRDSNSLLQRLFTHVYAPERRYEHVWRRGDLVIWDNMAVQHARTREANPADGPRVLQRVSFGKYSYADQREQRLPGESVIPA